jgi:hypothetical protein
MTKAPEKIYGWMDSQLSVARHYGGCTYQGHAYKVDYNDIDQPLVRSDILLQEKAEKKQKGKSLAKEIQLGLPL